MIIKKIKPLIFILNIVFIFSNSETLVLLLFFKECFEKIILIVFIIYQMLVLRPNDLIEISANLQKSPILFNLFKNIIIRGI